MTHTIVIILIIAWIVIGLLFLALKFAPKGWQGKDMLFHKGECPKSEDEYEYMDDQDYWHYK